MEIKLEVVKTKEKEAAQLLLLEEIKNDQGFSSEEISQIKKKLKGNFVTSYIRNNQTFFIVKVEESKEDSVKKEYYRRAGVELVSVIAKEKINEIQLLGNKEFTLAIAEGIILASYSFQKYKSKPQSFTLNKLIFIQKDIQPDEVKEFTNVCKAVYLTRDLVNEPLNNLSAVQLSDQFKELGKSAGFSVEVFNKKKIESLKMGGLLGVNMGSVDPPTFTILEYKPSKAINKNPYILVGKGVVYDTGGLSLKDSDGMSIMKCDMAGAAAVAGAMYAIAKNKLPIYIIGLIPATDNRPGGNAMAPGDVITISNGKTVEVLNTDAEGRLILADALSFATKYKPELVIDLATLTGAAARAIGKEGIVFMGNAKEKFKERLKKSGQEVFERLVEFPLWEEYQNYLKSDIADLKNIGPSEAGAITAGKFLENFVDYDWLHLDIAGSAFLGSPDFYRTKNATGVGVRLLYNFFKSIK
jgi:leucyl aminopeptidase